MEQRRNVLVYLKSPVDAFDMGQYVAERLGGDFAAFDVVVCGRFKELEERVADADVVVTWRFKAELYPLARRLKAVFTPAAGRDWVPDDPSGRVPVHHGAFHGPLVAETLLGQILHFNREMPRLLANQSRRVWDRDAQRGCRLLKDQTVLIVGYGNIGRACAKALKFFGCRVVGLKRSAASAADALGVELITKEGLRPALGQADHVALILPGEAETDGFFTREDFRAMKPSAFLHSLGRGNAVKTGDIVWAARNNVIAGFALDVFEEEPLPPGSPLWALDNVLVTPHAACVCANYRSEYYEELKAALRQKETAFFLPTPVKPPF